MLRSGAPRHAGGASRPRSRWEVTALERSEPGPSAAGPASPFWPPSPETGPAPDLLCALARACGLPALVWWPLPSGGGARLWLLGPRGGEGWPWVLKLRPAHAEVAALRALEPHGAAARAPHVVCAPPALRAALCMTRRPGHTLARRLHAGAAIPLGALAAAMAALHAVPPPPGLAADGHPAVWLAAQSASWGAGGTVAEPALPRLRELAARLPPPRPVVTHGAWFPRHVLVERGAVTGLVDWGTARLADPARDVASAVVGLFAEGVAGAAALALGADLARLYEAAAGHPLRAYAFHLLAAVAARAAAAARREAGQRDVPAPPAWGALLSLCLEQVPPGAEGMAPASGGTS